MPRQHNTTRLFPWSLLVEQEEGSMFFFGLEQAYFIPDKQQRKMFGTEKIYMYVFFVRRNCVWPRRGGYVYIPWYVHWLGTYNQISYWFCKRVCRVSLSTTRKHGDEVTSKLSKRCRTYFFFCRTKISVLWIEAEPFIFIYSVSAYSRCWQIKTDFRPIFFWAD